MPFTLPFSYFLNYPLHHSIPTLVYALYSSLFLFPPVFLASLHSHSRVCPLLFPFLISSSIPCITPFSLSCMPFTYFLQYSLHHSIPTLLYALYSSLFLFPPVFLASLHSHSRICPLLISSSIPCIIPFPLSCMPFTLPFSY